jgi:hypothetical protein
MLEEAGTAGEASREELRSERQSSRRAAQAAERAAEAASAEIASLQVGWALVTWRIVLVEAAGPIQQMSLFDKA